MVFHPLRVSGGRAAHGRRGGRHLRRSRPSCATTFRHTPGQHIALRTIGATARRSAARTPSAPRPPTEARHAARGHPPGRGRRLLDVRAQGAGRRRHGGGHGPGRPVHPRTARRALRRRSSAAAASPPCCPSPPPCSTRRAGGPLLPDPQRPHGGLDDVPGGGGRPQGPLSPTASSWSRPLPRGTAGRPALRPAGRGAADRSAACPLLPVDRASTAGSCAAPTAWSRAPNAPCAGSACPAPASTRRSSTSTTAPRPPPRAAAPAHSTRDRHPRRPLRQLAGARRRVAAGDGAAQPRGRPVRLQGRRLRHLPGLPGLGRGPHGPQLRAGSRRRSTRGTSWPASPTRSRRRWSWTSTDSTDPGGRPARRAGLPTGDTTPVSTRSRPGRHEVAARWPPGGRPAPCRDRARQAARCRSLRRTYRQGTPSRPNSCDRSRAEPVPAPLHLLSRPRILRNSLGTPPNSPTSSPFRRFRRCRHSQFLEPVLP